MIRSPYTPVSIPDIAVHDEMFLACNANADKTALVSKILLIEGQLLLVTIVKHIWYNCFCLLFCVSTATIFVFNKDYQYDFLVCCEFESWDTFFIALASSCWLQCWWIVLILLVPPGLSQELKPVWYFWSVSSVLPDGGPLHLLYNSHEATAHWQWNKMWQNTINRNLFSGINCYSCSSCHLWMSLLTNWFCCVMAT